LLEELINQPYHKGTHDNIVKQVVQRLEDSGLYDVIKHNVNYYLRKSNQFGEADVLARSGDKYFAFEIKSSFRARRKAYQQLEKDSRLLRREGCKTKPYLFRVYKSMNKLIYDRYRI
jgi:glutamine synthetase